MHSQHTAYRTAATLSRHWVRGLACLTLFAVLGACGFHLKGVTPLPFDTLYTNIPENSAFGAQIRRAIRAASPNTRFVSEPGEARARLTQLANNQSMREVSINPQGQVEEYELNLTFVFQLTDDKGHLVLPPTTLETIREIPYDSGALQAKQGEIGTLYIEMQQSLVDRIVRRLTAPEVSKAFNNPEDLPIAEPTAPAARTPPNTYQSPIPTPLSIPGAAPGTGMY
ncbi:LPS-assembly lipoprotein LptE [Eoetvoesiella caeni]|uniref:LPS-assembly lipoprotein LptE n=1 Tax=Eoetvoesiella caeni TaxID=645616 RepID=A0A366HMH9_9BURK|nr:LPS assembly lipoprotein LptE [Eoetvoesiella caeni]MCI2807177.1 LPS assembly lipoprotein LptE [Eoetvoesiella caeni]NYT53426.1 hypothetical protein [Eoetvoesiella caeni]RBP43411.1 LPS-assembly lipoprotein [Eoetvoesiella caeni]